MSRVPVEIRPISAGPYPLVPNEGPEYIPHEYFECGDPVNCEHLTGPIKEVKLEDFVKFIKIPNAESPKIFNSDEFEMMPDATLTLKKIGFDENYATSLAILFKDDLSDMAPEMDLDGFFHTFGYTDRSIDEIGERYKLCMYIRKGMSESKTNQVILHELGHALKYYEQRLQDIREQRLYHRTSLVRRTRLLGAIAGISAASLGAPAILENAPKPLQFICILGVLASEQTVVAPKKILWLFDKEERYCEHFRRHNKEIKLVRKVTPCNQ